MAVHLNARLNTRFIPFLFAGVILLILGVSLANVAHANDDSVLAPQATSEALAVSRDEIRAVMSEGTDPSRLDRRPGFSPIIVAPRPGEHPSTGMTASLSPRKEEEPTPGGIGSASIGHYLDFTDELPAQPQEAAIDQR